VEEKREGIYERKKEIRGYLSPLSSSGAAH